VPEQLAVVELLELGKPLTLAVAADVKDLLHLEAIGAVRCSMRVLHVALMCRAPTGQFGKERPGKQKEE
jgi:hypothetical protein